MKKLIIPGLCLLLFSACKETGPYIDFGPKPHDTDYVSTTIEEKDARMVVMEEFTGVACPPCYDAHGIIRGLETQYLGKLVVLGIQAEGPTQAKPIVASQHSGGVYTIHDNRTPKGTLLSQQVYGGLSAIPQAGIDRILINGNLLATSPSWATTIASRVTVPTDANVKVTSIYNGVTKQAYITVRVAYTSTVAKAQLLNVAIVEDSVIDAQEGGPGFTQNYIHQHVLRDILTAPSGTAILGNRATKQPGLVYERVFVYDLDQEWNPEHLRVIAYVSNDAGTDREVVQGGETHLK